MGTFVHRCKTYQAFLATVTRNHRSWGYPRPTTSELCDQIRENLTGQFCRGTRGYTGPPWSSTHLTLTKNRQRLAMYRLEHGAE